MEFSKADTIKAHLTIAKLHNDAEAIAKYEAELEELNKPKITTITSDEIFGSTK